MGISHISTIKVFITAVIIIGNVSWATIPFEYIDETLDIVDNHMEYEEFSSPEYDDDYDIPFYNGMPNMLGSQGILLSLSSSVLPFQRFNFSNIHCAEQIE